MAEQRLLLEPHIHIGLGQGDLSPLEALRIAEKAGLHAVILLLRGDWLSFLPRVRKEVRSSSLFCQVEAFVGVELVHVPPPLLPDAVNSARLAGAPFVAVHGEGASLAPSSIPVAEGTNLAAVLAEADMLVHPGIVDEPVAQAAAERGVFLEISTYPAHAFANAQVAQMAQKTGAPLLWGSKAHAPADFPTLFSRDQIASGALIGDAQRDSMRIHAREVLTALRQLEKGN